MATTKPKMRDLILTSTKTLLEQRGPRATTIDAVIENSGAPRGSVYYYFSGGREQMVEEAVGLAMNQMIAIINHAFSKQHNVKDAVRLFFRLWAQELLENKLHSGCAIVAVAIEGKSAGEKIQSRAKFAFDQWEAALFTAIKLSGVPEKRAKSLANLILSAGEGAVILCRTQNSIDPLLSVAKEIETLLPS